MDGGIVCVGCWRAVAVMRAAEGASIILLSQQRVVHGHSMQRAIVVYEIKALLITKDVT